MTLLFILGTGRCGSTMVQEVICRHPDVGFVSNVDAKFSALGSKGRWNNALYQRTPLKYTQRDRLRISLPGDPGEYHFGPSEAYRILEKEVSPMVSISFRDLTAEDVTPWVEKRFRAFFERRIAAQRKAVFLHKFTGWPRARFIHEVFPSARFIHVVRDGRDVANSLVQRPWWKGYRGLSDWRFGPLPSEYEREWEASGRDFVVLAGLEWKVVMDAFEAARASIPDDLWMEVRYEDFVEAPRARLSEIFDFVGLTWSKEFESRFSQFTFTKAKKNRHHRDLTPAQIEALDEVLRTHLVKFGYEQEAEILSVGG
jgi:hypothetical protein